MNTPKKSKRQLYADLSLLDQHSYAQQKQASTDTLDTQQLFHSLLTTLAERSQDVKTLSDQIAAQPAVLAVSESLWNQLAQDPQFIWLFHSAAWLSHDGHPIHLLDQLDSPSIVYYLLFSNLVSTSAYTLRLQYQETRLLDNPVIQNVVFPQLTQFNLTDAPSLGLANLIQIRDTFQSVLLGLGNQSSAVSSTTIDVSELSGVLQQLLLIDFVEDTLSTITNVTQLISRLETVSAQSNQSNNNSNILANLVQNNLNKLERDSGRLKNRLLVIQDIVRGIPNLFSLLYTLE